MLVLIQIWKFGIPFCSNFNTPEHWNEKVLDLKAVKLSMNFFVEERLSRIIESASKRSEVNILFHQIC